MPRIQDPSRCRCSHFLASKVNVGEKNYLFSYVHFGALWCPKEATEEGIHVTRAKNVPTDQRQALWILTFSAFCLMSFIWTENIELEKEQETHLIWYNLRVCLQVWFFFLLTCPGCLGSSSSSEEICNFWRHSGPWEGTPCHPWWLWHLQMQVKLTAVIAIEIGRA